MIRPGDTHGLPLVPSLQKRRLLIGLSQRDLSTRAKVARSTIADLELGISSARPSTMRKLAKALKCKPADLQKKPDPTEPT